MYKLTKLKNGLQVVTYRMPHIHSVTSCVFVGVGSRYETKNQAGISHFLEHMFFKGTQSRPSQAEVGKAIEGLGGYVNAATSRECTYFYNFLPQIYFKKGIEFLADIMKHSLFEPNAIEREKGVVLQEINMILDDPARHVFDVLTEMMWPDQSLGRDIAGTKQSVISLGRRGLVGYVDKHYRPQNMIISMAGNLKHDIILKEVEKYFGSQTGSEKIIFAKAEDKQTKPRIKILNKKTDQAHVCFGFRSLPYNHQQEAVLTVLDTILGEGFSSRLMINVREKLGLAYAIYSLSEKYRDTGLFGVTAGVEIAKTKELVKAVLMELNKLKKELVLKSELEKVKKYLKGRLMLQMDEGDKMAAWYGYQLLFYPKVRTPQERIRAIEKVTARDIQLLARKLFVPSNTNLAVIGPFDKRDEKRFRGLLK